MNKTDTVPVLQGLHCIGGDRRQVHNVSGVDKCFEESDKAA